MTQKGPHTWDLTLQYHLCPECRRIIESREDFKYCLGNYIKDVECSECHHIFTLIKPPRPTFGPIFGERVAPEWDWS